MGCFFSKKKHISFFFVLKQHISFTIGDAQENAGEGGSYVAIVQHALILMQATCGNTAHVSISRYIILQKGVLLDIAQKIWETN